MAALKPGTNAPAVELPVLGGGTFSLGGSLSRGPVALAFFKVSCPVCQYAFPYFDRMAKLLQENRLTLVGISQDDGPSTAEFVKRVGVHFPIALDDRLRYQVSNAYGLTTVPTLFRIDEDGTISHTIVSWSREDMESLYAEFCDSQNTTHKLFETGEDIAQFKAG